MQKTVKRYRKIGESCVLMLLCLLDHKSRQERNIHLNLIHIIVTSFTLLTDEQTRAAASRDVFYEGENDDVQRFTCSW